MSPTASKFAVGQQNLIAASMDVQQQIFTDSNVQHKYCLELQRDSKKDTAENKKDVKICLFVRQTEFALQNQKNSNLTSGTAAAFSSTSQALSINIQHT